MFPAGTQAYSQTDILLELPLLPDLITHHWGPGGRWLSILIRLVLGGIFVYAGLAKLMDVRGFAILISQYNLAPDWALGPLALGLPILELAAGVGLMLDLRGGLPLVTALLVFFCLVLWFGVLQGLDVDCGCFSPQDQDAHDGLRHALLRDLIMLATVAYLYFCKRGTSSALGGRGWGHFSNLLQLKENDKR